MDSIDFTTVLKLFSVTVFWSFSSVCRLFHAVGAENVKASFSQFSSVFAWWLWEQQMTKCQENKDCNFHIWSLKDLLIQLLGYLTWLITLLNDVSFSYPYLEDVYNVNFGVFRLWFLIFFPSVTGNQMWLLKLARWLWESLRTTLSLGTGYCCESVHFLVVTVTEMCCVEHHKTKCYLYLQAKQHQVIPYLHMNCFLSPLNWSSQLTYWSCRNTHRYHGH